jgi:nitrogen-specific signal transduction histidine kinase
MINDLLEVTHMQAGKLTIELQANHSRKIRGPMSDENPELLLLEVSDTGCGVSPHLKERIFDRPYQGADLATAGPKGLRLGLCVCKELVDAKANVSGSRTSRLAAQSFASRCRSFRSRTWWTR